MASTFSWLAFSEDERRKVLDVVNLFGDRDTRDELGLGTVRDAFADLFFPGISTIQTRARYFLFVPWIYLELERKGKSSREIESLARWEESKLIEVLATEEGEGKGVIGYAARKSLKRMPSNIYWQGLGAWRIRLFQGGQEAYQRSLDRFYVLTKHKSDSLDAKLGEILPAPSNWHAALPRMPRGFPAGSTFDLSVTEAEYLQERILTSVPNSLLAFFVKEATTWDARSIEFPWLHPSIARLSALQRDQLRHAENFADVMYGASLLYNMILAELANKTELQKFYKESIEAWANELRSKHNLLASWDRRAFWRLVRGINPRVAIATERFVERWTAMALDGAGALAITTTEQGRTLIRDREIALKGDLARVKNRRALEQWGGNAGAYRLNYRWGKAQPILLDILQPLNGP